MRTLLSTRLHLCGTLLLLAAMLLGAVGTPHPTYSQQRGIPTAASSPAVDLHLQQYISGQVTNLIERDALLYGYDGFSVVIYDVRIQAQPRLIGSLPFNHNLNQLIIDGDYLYATWFYISGIGMEKFDSMLTVIDIHDPTQPFIAREIPYSYEYTSGGGIVPNVSQLSIMDRTLLWNNGKLIFSLDLDDPVNAALQTQPNTVPDLLDMGISYNEYSIKFVRPWIHVYNMSNPISPTLVYSTTHARPDSFTTSLKSSGAYIFEIDTNSGSVTDTHALNVYAFNAATGVISAVNTLPLSSTSPYQSYQIQAIVGHYLYLNMGGTGYAPEHPTQVYDIADPANPALVGTMPQLVNAAYLLVESASAVFIGKQGSVCRWDTSDPLSWSEVGCGRTSTLTLPTNGGIGGAGYVFYPGPLSYPTETTSRTISIWDAHNPEQGHLISEISIPGFDRLIYHNQRIYATSADKLYTINVADPQHPMLTSSAAMVSQGWWVHSMDVFNNQLYINIGGLDTVPHALESSLQIFDLSTPDQPALAHTLELDYVIYTFAHTNQRLYAAGGWIYDHHAITAFEPDAQAGLVETARYAVDDPLYELHTIQESLLGSDPGGQKLYGLDLRDITNIKPLPGFPSTELHTQHSMAVAGTQVYLNKNNPIGPEVGHTDLVMLDLSNPDQPTAHTLLQRTHSGSVLLSSGRLYIAGMQTSVFRYNDVPEGQVRTLDGQPFAQATINLDNQPTDTSGLPGTYDLPAALAARGQRTATVRPSYADYTFWPAERQVDLAQPSSQSFIVLAGPVSSTLTPALSSTLTYVSLQNTLISANIPVGAVSTTAVLSITPHIETDTTSAAVVGTAFELSATSADSALTSFAQPVQLTLTFRDRDIATLSDPGQLQLLRWDAGAWTPAQQRCATPADQQLDLDAHTLSVAVCQPGRYALYGPSHMLYLPLTAKP